MDRSMPCRSHQTGNASEQAAELSCRQDPEPWVVIGLEGGGHLSPVPIAQVGLSHRQHAVLLQTQVPPHSVSDRVNERTQFGLHRSRAALKLNQPSTGFRNQLVLLLVLLLELQKQGLAAGVPLTQHAMEILFFLGMME